VDNSRLWQAMRYLVLRIPLLRQIAQRRLWQLRAKWAYKQRPQNVPDLLRKYNVRSKGTSCVKYVIFIVIDALRKDHLSLYGYEHETTPFLKSLQQKAAVFENTYTASPWTLPSVASMLTGLYPHNHGGMHAGNSVRNLDKQFSNKVRQDILSLPDILDTLGFGSYFGAAISPAAMATAGWFKRPSVFLGGSDHHTKRLLKWLRSASTEKKFIYFHVADLHWPINAPREYRNTFGPIADIPKLSRWQFNRGQHLGEPEFERFRSNRFKLYDCALRFVDEQIRKIFQSLDDVDILDSSLIFVTADHGEEFWDHVELEKKLFSDPRGVYGIGHGHNLFQEVINVPLLCMGPGIISGHYNHNVSLVNLVPTVLQVCEIEHELPLDGCSLFNDADERPLISEGIAYGHEKKAVIKKNWKLIHSEGDGVSLLFDLSQDPEEKHNLAKLFPDKLAELKDLIPKTQVTGETLEVDRDVQEQLRQLGYIE
jgi:arylsulfatase A-like enzyme